MPKFEVRVTEERMGIVVIDDEASLEAAYERAELMNVWGHAHEVCINTTFDVREVIDTKK